MSDHFGRAMKKAEKNPLTKAGAKQSDVARMILTRETAMKGGSRASMISATKKVHAQIHGSGKTGITRGKGSFGGGGSIAIKLTTGTRMRPKLRRKHLLGTVKSDRFVPR